MLKLFVNLYADCRLVWVPILFILHTSITNNELVTQFRIIAVLHLRQILFILFGFDFSWDRSLYELIWAVIQCKAKNCIGISMKKFIVLQVGLKVVNHSSYLCQHKDDNNVYTWDYPVTQSVSKQHSCECHKHFIYLLSSFKRLYL